MEHTDDHDLLIRIDENVKSTKDNVDVLFEMHKAHEERISKLEGDMKAEKVRTNIWAAVIVGLSGGISALFKFWR